MNPAKFSHFDDEINAEAKKSAASMGRENGNIEDQIRVANELLRGLEIIAESNEDIKTRTQGLNEDLNRILGEFASSILTRIIHKRR